MKRRILTMENDTGKRDSSFSVLTMENDPGFKHPLNVLTLAGTNGERFLKNAPYKINTSEASSLYITHCGLMTQLDDFSGIIYKKHKYQSFTKKENNKIRAFLDTIAFCENTYHQEAYNAFFAINREQQKKYLKEFYLLWNNDKQGFKNNFSNIYKKRYSGVGKSFPRHFKEEYYFQTKANTYNNIINFLDTEIILDYECTFPDEKKRKYPILKTLVKSPTQSVLVNDRYVYNSATHTTSKGSFTPTSAFGRYQFVAGTWDTRWKQMHQHPRIHPKSKDLSRDSSIIDNLTASHHLEMCDTRVVELQPILQDAACLLLMGAREMIDELLKVELRGDKLSLRSNDIFESTCNKGNKEWESFEKIYLRIRDSITPETRQEFFTRRLKFYENI